MSQLGRLTGENVALDICLAGDGITWIPFGAIRNLDLDNSKAEFDATAGLDTNLVRRTGKKDFKLTGAYVFEHDNVEILDAAEGSAPVQLRAYLDKINHPGKYWTGFMNVSGTVSIPYDNIVTGNLSVTAAESIVRTWT